MKAKILIVTVVVAAVIVLRAILLLHPSVRVGQVWVYESPDPFLEIVSSNTVIAIQDGYVSFVNQRGHRHSRHKSLFTINSRLIKTNDHQEVTTMKK